MGFATLKNIESCRTTMIMDADLMELLIQMGVPYSMCGSEAGLITKGVGGIEYE